jgi:hypothetical protein
MKVNFIRYKARIFTNPLHIKMEADYFSFRRIQQIICKRSGIMSVTNLTSIMYRRYSI